MNLTDSAFLCLDIGAHTVRGAARAVRGGRLTRSAQYAVSDPDTAFAIKSVTDELEQQLSARFDSAYITGNFGAADFAMMVRGTNWQAPHKITGGDVRMQIADIRPPDDFYPMHIIPMRYDGDAARNLTDPVGHTDRRLTSVFGAIFYERARTALVFDALRRAHITTDGMFDPSFLVAQTLRAKGRISLLVDLGAEFTTVSLWTARGPVFFQKLDCGQAAITDRIADRLNISRADAERIKHAALNAVAQDMDRFTPADPAFDFSRGDVGDIARPMLVGIVESAHDAVAEVMEKYAPDMIVLFGGGSNISGIDGLFADAFGAEVRNLGDFASVAALSDMVWKSNSARASRLIARRDKIAKLIANITPHRKKPAKFIPVMPSSLAFDMKDSNTYAMFKSAGISMLHIDIMDGFFVGRVVGGIEELKSVRERTDAHLHVHLMTESPAAWARAAASAGADTIIVSTNTAGVRAALIEIRKLGKRCGIALGPGGDVAILKPVLKEIDEILVMSVTPGRGGQEFDEGALQKISTLANTRKKYGLKYKISVDGGINPATAKLCRAAGADFLVVGTYLASAPDFPLAVQSLIDN